MIGVLIVLAKLLGLLVGLGIFYVVICVILATEAPVEYRLRVKWAEAAAWDPVLVDVKRRRWLWFSRNTVWGNTIYEGGPEGMNAPTTRHELIHVRQWRLHGLLWILFLNGGTREAEAEAAQDAAYPQFEEVSV